MILRVGITGGIGSGKTTAAKIFSVLGVPVFNADAAAKNLMHSDEAVKQKIITTFGSQAYESELLNRKFLATIVFNDYKKLEKLNAIVHPATIQAGEKWMKEQTTPYAIKEAALIFESSAIAGLDYIIGVYAPQNLRIKRVIARDKISKEEIFKRMNKQIDETIKMQLCDFVIINNEGQLVTSQILKIHKQLLEKATQ